ncbi:unnamed protein product, partial [Iphiclides podalirius]
MLPDHQFLVNISRSPSRDNYAFQYSKYLQQKKYAVFLDEAFGLETMPVPSTKTQQHAHLCPSRRPEEAYLKPWPCVPRDRNNDNILVAALGRRYHKWSWRTQGLINQGVTKHEIQCCKFHPRGGMLATLTWHPWRSALLAVGAVTTNIYARVALWDAPAARLREYTLSHKHYYLDAMLFSHRTGEMVVSLWNPEDNDKKKKSKCRRFSAIPVYLDKTTKGYSLR